MADTQRTQTEGFIVDVPADQADYLDGPDPKYMDESNKTDMAKARKYEQTLAARGVKPLTPTFPELFTEDSSGG